MDEKNENEQEKKEVKLTDKVEIGSLKDHIEAAKRGMLEYKIWNSLTYALIQMAHPNELHRIDLRDKDCINKIAQALNMKVDYEIIETEIMTRPFLIFPNFYRESKYKEDNGDVKKEKITKKQEQINKKREKIQAKITSLKENFNGIKDKKCDRALKLQRDIDEMEIKLDRTI